LDRRRFAYLCTLALANMQMRVSGQSTEKSTSADHRPGYRPSRREGSKFGALYNVPRNSIYTYETFDRLKDNPAVDAVYIALPNSMHCEFTIRAAEACKHVLCEKPMAISSAECRRMIEACRHANVN
jgi:predicted dehydrogenase